MSNLRAILALDVGERALIGNAWWTRVPGGWIVTETWINTKADEVHLSPPVYVPEPSDTVTSSVPQPIHFIQPPVGEPTTIVRQSKMNTDNTD